MQPNETFAADVDRVLAEIGDMLKAKNAAYGNSALDPIRIFSRADTIEQLHVRIDDKLSRVKRGSAAGEDVVRDLVGYFVLLIIAREHAIAAARKDLYEDLKRNSMPVAIADPKVAAHQFEVASFERGDLP